MSTFEQMVFARHMATERAIEAAWRKAKRSNAAVLLISDMVREIVSKCPHADQRYIGRELRRRIERYRPRHRKGSANEVA